MGYYGAPQLTNQFTDSEDLDFQKSKSSPFAMERLLLMFFSLVRKHILPRVGYNGAPQPMDQLTVPKGATYDCCKS